MKHSEGLWQLSRAEEVEDDGGRLGSDTYTFLFDGSTVTLRLLTLRAGQWRSDDDIYRLAADFDGHTLRYRPPFGEWTELATFEDGRFVDVGSGRKRIFERIADSEVADFNRALLRPARAPHDYRIQPDGSVLSG